MVWAFELEWESEGFSQGPPVLQVQLCLVPHAGFGSLELQGSESLEYKMSIIPSGMQVIEANSQ